MADFNKFFSWGGSKDVSDEEIPKIFPLDFQRADFIRADMIGIYTKILTDVVERVHGLNDDDKLILWDNCVKSDSSDGLITLLAKAMSDKSDLFLVYEEDVNVLRKATSDEQKKIKDDYEKEAESSTGVYISFKNYVRSDMVKLYSGLEYCTVGALNKSLNLSMAVQVKLDSLRSSVSVMDSQDTKKNAMIIAKGLGKGSDVLLDAKDMIMTATPDLTATKDSIDFLNQKRAFYLGLPESYINGEQTGGLGSTGENDTKAIERGLKAYYSSIIRPVLIAIFGEDLEIKYKSQDFRQIDQGLNALKVFELTGDEFISGENKKKVIEALFDLEEEPYEEPVAEPLPVLDVTPPVAPGSNPPVKANPSRDSLRAQ